MIYKRYQFKTKKQAEKKVDSLSKNMKASIIWLDKFVKINGTYSEQGEEITVPIFTNPYSLDVVWDDLDESPYGWKSYEIEPKNPEHTIL